MNDFWSYAPWLYVGIAMATFIPVLIAILEKVSPKKGGKGFDDSPHFTDEEKELLKQHFSRIGGTLGYWKNTAAKYQRFHIYCLFWTIPSSVFIPILTQAITDENPDPKILVTIISAFTAILLAFHRGFKVEENYKAFRHGESEFYDLYRRLLDRPQSFGETIEEQIDNYFKEVETVRRFVRNAETDNLATMDDAKNILQKQQDLQTPAVRKTVKKTTKKKTPAKKTKK